MEREYWYEVNITMNEYKGGVRDRIAEFLRRLAVRMDNRLCVAFEIKSNPKLPYVKKVEAIRTAVSSLPALVSSEVENTVKEEALRIAMPHLYD